LLVRTKKVPLILTFRDKLELSVGEKKLISLFYSTFSLQEEENFGVNFS
jgi:hypothetical protein